MISCIYTFNCARILTFKSPRQPSDIKILQRPLQRHHIEAYRPISVHGITLAKVGCCTGKFLLFAKTYAGGGTAEGLLVAVAYFDKHQELWLYG